MRFLIGVLVVVGTATAFNNNLCQDTCYGTFSLGGSRTLWLQSHADMATFAMYDSASLQAVSGKAMMFCRTSGPVTITTVVLDGIEETGIIPTNCLPDKGMVAMLQYFNDQSYHNSFVCDGCTAEGMGQCLSGFCPELLDVPLGDAGVGLVQVGSDVAPYLVNYKFENITVTYVCSKSSKGEIQEFTVDLGAADELADSFDYNWAQISPLCVQSFDGTWGVTGKSAYTISALLGKKPYKVQKKVDFDVKAMYEE